MGKVMDPGKDALDRGLADITSLYQRQQSLPSYTPPSASTLAAQAMMAEIATKDNPSLSAAQNQVNATLSGYNMQQGNPFLQQMIGQTQAALRPQLDGSFEQAGRYGSGAHANAVDSALANSAANLAFQQYNSERANQMAAVNAVPALTNARFTPANQLAQSGAMQDSLNQAILNQKLNNPYINLNNYMKLVGNYSQLTKPPESSTKGKDNSQSDALGAVSQVVGIVTKILSLI